GPKGGRHSPGLGLRRGSQIEGYSGAVTAAQNGNGQRAGRQAEDDKGRAEGQRAGGARALRLVGGADGSHAIINGFCGYALVKPCGAQPPPSVATSPDA